MIDFESAEPQVLALLAPLQSDGVQVRGMPNQPQRQGTDMPGGARVVVGWFGSKPAGKASLDGSAMAMSNRIVVDVFAPSLNGATGIYQLPRRIQKMMQGQRVPGLGMLEFEGWELAERSELKAAYYRAVMMFSVLSLVEGQ